MATFTLELWQVLDSFYGNSMDDEDYAIERKPMEYEGVNYGGLPWLDDYGPIGLGDYPIFDEAYRPILNGKILEEYYHQEIGQETEEYFVWRLRAKMNQIMPLMNQYYESAKLEYTALDTIRIRSERNSQSEGSEKSDVTSNTDTENKSGSRAIGSDFPQMMLAADADYASTGSDVNTTSEIDTTQIANSETNTDAETIEDNLTTGYQGAASDLINKFRNSFINTDAAVLEGLADNFMMVLNNGDEYFARGSY
jgi:hypothetical protein